MDTTWNQVWGKKLSGVEWSGAEWSRGVESIFQNTQYMYIQEINVHVYLFLRYTKNMVTLGLCYNEQNAEYQHFFFLNLGQARKYCLVSKWPGNLVRIIE